MKKHQALIIAISLSTAALTPKAFALDDAIIAIVNSEVITLRDLKDYIHNTYISLVAEGIGEDQLRSIMSDLQVNGINKLIEDKLILSKANELGLEIRDKIVDDRLAEIKKKYTSDEIFTDALIRNGATISDLRKKILEQFKIKYVIDDQVRSKIFVNPQEVTDFYERNLESYQKKERVNLDSIFITFKNDKDAARAKADEALKLIQEGKDFTEIAKTYSESPSVGVMERGQLQPNIEEKIFKLKEGEISSAIEVPNGIYIFKLLKRFPTETAPLKEVKDGIYDLLFKKKFKDRFTKWLDKLKKNAYIEIKQ